MSSITNIPEPITKLGGSHSIAYMWRIKPENYHLIGSQCEKCGKKIFPRAFHVCSYCTSRDVRDIQLAHTGTIVHGCFTRGGVQGFEDVFPLIFATVKLDDDGPWVEGELVNISQPYKIENVIEPSGYELWDELKGKRVRMVVRRLKRLDNGALSYGYKFYLEKTLKSKGGTIPNLPPPPKVMPFRDTGQGIRRWD
jgi:uncharacterized OB-fold protein